MTESAYSECREDAGTGTDGCEQGRGSVAAVVRLVLWTLYAVPVTFLFLYIGVFAILQRGALAVVDLGLSLPLYLVVQLHIWNKRLLNPLVWRAYAFVFVGWQLAYALVLAPAQSGKRPEWDLILWFGLQLPMFVAAFRYAFGRWSRNETDPASGESAGPANGKLGLVALAIIAFVMGFGLVGVSVVSFFAENPRYSVSNLAPERGVYEPDDSGSVVTGVPPVIATQLSATERGRLRQLFEAGDYDELNESLDQLQRAYEKDPTREQAVVEAFRLFTLPDDESNLNAWVDHDPSSYQPFVARAEYNMKSTWRARGTKWARETSARQFRQMEWWLEETSADVDAALSLNERAVSAHAVLITIHMARGEDLEEAAAFENARDTLPNSLHLYLTYAHANRPRWGGSYEVMERIAEEGIQRNPDDPRFNAVMGLLYHDQAEMLSYDNRDSQAVEVYTEALDLADTAQAREARSRSYLALYDTPAALRDVDRAIELDPYSASARLLRAGILGQQGETRGAVADVYAARELAPEDPEVLEWVRWLESDEGKAALRASEDL